MERATGVLRQDGESRALALVLAMAVLLVGCVTAPSSREGIHAKVILVADGDTITVLTEDKHQQRVRIAGIDAPEKGQPFADRSRQNLVSLTVGKDATLQCHKIDRYQRTVCKVWVPSRLPKMRADTGCGARADQRRPCVVVSGVRQ
jgi:endonuclease YncB( thermonuclease family)